MDWFTCSGATETPDNSKNASIEHLASSNATL